MASTPAKSRPQAKAAKPAAKPAHAAKAAAPGSKAASPGTKAAKPGAKAPKLSTNSFEVLRAWVDDGDLHTDFISNLWEPAGYGAFLADLARQISDGILEDNPGLKSASVLAAIRDGFLDELDQLSDAEMVRSSGK